MWIDSVIEYDIIVETLTGAEIEVTVTDDDTIGYIKTHIQKYEGNFFRFFLFSSIFIRGDRQHMHLFRRFISEIIVNWTRKAIKNFENDLSNSPRQIHANETKETEKKNKQEQIKNRI